MTLTAIALVAGLVFSAHAAALPGADRVVQYAVVDQDIGGVINGIASSLGLRADVSANVHGDVHGRLPQAQAGDMLRRLGAIYSFDWYCDGQTLYISGYGEAQHKMLQLGPVSGSQLLATLDALGISDPRWPVRIPSGGTIALVNGPPHFVSLVEQTSSALASGVKADISEVKVFRGEAGS